MSATAPILLVDDQPASLLALEAALEPLGQPCVRAESGEEALRILLRQEFAVVLIDARLPGITGPQTIHLMKQADRTRYVPAILLTAFPEGRRQGYTAGAAECMLKPFAPEALRAKVEAMVDLFLRRGQSRALEVSARDEMTRRVLEEEQSPYRRRSELQLQRTAELRERFLGAVGHDLRTPLSAILFASQMLERGELAPEAMRRASRRIHASAERMSQMITELLDFTRGRLGGGIPVALQSVDLAALCREVVDEVRLANPGRRLELVSDQEVPGRWDAMRLSQVVTHLVSNALRYGPPDSRVSVRVRAEERDAELEVHNEGEPIPEALLPHLFEPFLRGEPRGRSSGLGLGLYIVQQGVMSHGGMVEVHSTEEEGTTFRIRLPRSPPRVSAGDAHPSPAPLG